jgi:hypothetical protein
LTLYVRPQLLGGDQRLFLNDSPSFLSVRHRSTPPPAR